MIEEMSVTAVEMRGNALNSINELGRYRAVTSGNGIRRRQSLRRRVRAGLLC